MLPTTLRLDFQHRGLAKSTLWLCALWTISPLTSAGRQFYQYCYFLSTAMPFKWIPRVRNKGSFTDTGPTKLWAPRSQGLSFTGLWMISIQHGAWHTANAKCLIIRQGPSRNPCAEAVMVREWHGTYSLRNSKQGLKCALKPEEKLFQELKVTEDS